MQLKLSRTLSALAGLFLFAFAASGQTSSLSGEVKGEDGQPLKDAWIKIERKDIKGSYKVKTNKKGEYFHAGLPLGTYDVMLEVDGKVRDQVKGVRTKLGDPTPVNFNLEGQKKRQEAVATAAASGTLTKEQERGMSPEEKAALEKSMKERQQMMAKGKELNDAFNTGMEAMKLARQAEADLARVPAGSAQANELKHTIEQQCGTAVDKFTNASGMEAGKTQHVVWSNLAEALMCVAKTKTGEDQKNVMNKGFEAYAKAIELKPDEGGYHNNFALALAKGGKFPEAQAELTKAAQIEPQAAGRYYYNLGALLVNGGQLEPAGEAFKKAIDADPKYADAYYQYGIYLISKAKTDEKGKVTPEPGTKEAFQKYLELKADGPYAQAARDMITMLDTQISTEYKNPDAPAQKKGAKKK